MFVCSVSRISGPALSVVHGHVMVRDYGGPVGAQQRGEAYCGGLGALVKKK